SLLSATAGASLAFLLSRYLGRDFVVKVTHGRVQKFDEKIGEHGFYTVLYLRLVPLFPFNILNFSLGLTKVKFREYFLGTLLGMIPGAFVYTSIGGASGYLDLKNPRSWFDYRVWGPFALVIILSLIPKLIKKFRYEGVRSKG
ncbi:MAG: TVP38/TMEM64 family protein, partial [bacterium]|nr:TVP38/TMEM64 family protein [bacterium]